MPLIHPPHDPRRTDSRLYKGGDGGAGAMREQEAQRQAQVQAAVDAINGRFGVGNPAAGAQRQSMYDDIAGAVRDSALRGLDQQYTKASNANLFGLARSGLLGGSADAESGGDLQRVYGEGRVKAEQQGVQAAADLRNQDEGTRQRLIEMAQSGLDTGTAASLAEGQMSSAAQLAKSQAQSASVGDLFGNLGQAYLTNQVLRARYPNGLPLVSQPSVPSSTVFNPGSSAGGRIQ